MTIKNIIIVIVLLFTNSVLFSQEQNFNDTITKNLNEVIIKASRIPVMNKFNTNTISIVSPEVLSTLSRSIGAEEAFRLTPGVRIDNQANGSRIHMSIRGQGILSERGLRGIKVLIDGIPVNDPTGFAADLYDVDWGLVNNIEVLRGASASMYGGSSSAGILNISTPDKYEKEFGSKVSFIGGSNNFYKENVQFNGTKDNVSYLISYSKTNGDGYRDHTRFWGNNIYEKVKWNCSNKLNVTQIFMLTDYFNQNAEGLNIDQVIENPKQANPDANPFNEYQKTHRITNGIQAEYKLTDKHSFNMLGFCRTTSYKETSNKAAQYRNLATPGGSFSYNFATGKNKLHYKLALGSDFQWQKIDEHKFKSKKDSLRVDCVSDDNLEDTILLANQIIEQSSIGAFLINQVEIMDKLSISLNLRYDMMYNKLTDKLSSINNMSGSKDFDKATVKLGATYIVNNYLNIYANWGTGFLPPATEELASNPDNYGGFNQHLIPASSEGEEIGFKGSFGKYLSYDVTLFMMNTNDDFFRFKLTPARGNQEVFYGNAGESLRKGVESYIKFIPTNFLSLQAAYTYSDFKYTSPTEIKNQYLPNSPEHQLYTELEYNYKKKLKIALSDEMQSDWYIFTDPVNYSITQSGFNLIHARVSYEMKIKNTSLELSFYVKNIGDTKYIAFTEPDPDKNSYQPGSGREFFGGIKFKF